MKVHEEVDDRCQEVLSRVLKERLRSTLLITAFVQRGQQRCRRLRCSSQVGDILPLDGVDSVGIFHIREVHDVEGTVLRQMPVFFVLAILVEQVLRQRREFIVVYHHGKPLSRMLADEWVYDAEGLSRSRRTQHDCSTEGINDVNPSFPHPLVEVVHHRDVHRVLVLVLLLRLLERLVLEVKPIIAQLVVIIPCDAVQSLMHQHRSDDRR